MHWRQLLSGTWVDGAAVNMLGASNREQSADSLRPLFLLDIDRVTPKDRTVIRTGFSSRSSNIRLSWLVPSRVAPTKKHQHLVAHWRLAESLR